MHFVTALEHDVVIEIRPRAGAKGAGRVRVVGAALGFERGFGGWTPPMRDAHEWCAQDGFSESPPSEMRDALYSPLWPL